ncbi:hypothetical protein VCEM1676A_003084 [Vibrio cholerae O1 str. EM-1676A]|nr:hypothetical protein VCEM1676A_003084 [Vibrio cholerae O1 str. EM-1676A]
MWCLSLVVMRCQPLRRALCSLSVNRQIIAGNLLPASKFLPRQFSRYHALKAE